MSVNVFEVDQEALDAQMYKEFGKTKEDLKEYVDSLRKWTQTQPHFPEEPPDAHLRQLILYNKFSIEKAKQKLDMYYTIRALMPEFYGTTPFAPEMALHSKVVHVVPLPKPTEDGKRIIYSRVNPEYGASDFDHQTLIATFTHLAELIMLEDKSFNFHYVFDAAGVQTGHIPKFSPMIIRKASIIIEKVYSNRIASFYVVNLPPFMESVINNVVKPMLNTKIRDRLSVLCSADILLETFGKAALPKDIGGEGGSLEELREYVYNKYEENKDRYELLRKLKVDESLRPEPLVNDDILGYYGNFKKISVD